MRRLAVLAATLVFVSCATKPVPPTIEYVSVDPDYTKAREGLFANRPGAPELRPVETMSDVVFNSLQFQDAYERWVSYAVSLEDWIKSL